MAPPTVSVFAPTSELAVGVERHRAGAEVEILGAAKVMSPFQAWVLLVERTMGTGGVVERRTAGDCEAAGADRGWRC